MILLCTTIPLPIHESKARRKVSHPGDGMLRRQRESAERRTTDPATSGMVAISTDSDGRSGPLTCGRHMVWM